MCGLHFLSQGPGILFFIYLFYFMFILFYFIFLWLLFYFLLTPHKFSTQFLNFQCHTLSKSILFYPNTNYTPNSIYTIYIPSYIILSVFYIIYILSILQIISIRFYSNILTENEVATSIKMLPILTWIQYVHRSNILLILELVHILIYKCDHLQHNSYITCRFNLE